MIVKDLLELVAKTEISYKHELIMLSNRKTGECEMGYAERLLSEISEEVKNAEIVKFHTPSQEYMPEGDLNIHYNL